MLIPWLEGGQLGDRLGQIPLGADRIAEVNSFGFMARQFGGQTPWHSRPFEVSDGRSPEIVKQPARALGQLTGARPRAPEIFDLSAIRPTEYPRHPHCHATLKGRRFDRIRIVTALLQERGQGGMGAGRELPAFSVFRCTGVETHHA
jgi:hypothetical protein